MFDQDIVGLRRRMDRLHDLKMSEMIKLGASNKKMAETPSDYHNHKEDMMMIMCEKFQTGPQVVPRLEDTQEFTVEIRDESKISTKGFHDQEQENSTKDAEFTVPDEHSETGRGRSRRGPRKRYGNLRRCIGSSSDEFVEETSDGFTREVPSLPRKSSKRKRVVEPRTSSSVKRRRAKINQKIRLLQNLIPNCNEADKASVLDKAVDYMKSLQLQLQVMSMGIRPYMLPMMSPMAVAMAMSPVHCNIPSNAAVAVAAPFITPFKSPLSTLLLNLSNHHAPISPACFQCPLGFFVRSSLGLSPYHNELYDRLRFV
ncbi:PREDICTED: transcription factor PIF3 [Tarenaya hassleriana]|uniref:transcription factor PIF3 n=1 Tax=Tarenaya hassleriana TaxID=28532 RepID=UPI00053C52CE|nr:PREDICTED: transcription factor PIF3 [Tarenaya hassleriana]